MSEHAASCGWGRGGEPCRQFSTDGTRMGAAIAHTMGTADEEEIVLLSREEARKLANARLTGMNEEQADWDDEPLVDYGRMHEPLPYSGELDWHDSTDFDH